MSFGHIGNVKINSQTRKGYILGHISENFINYLNKKKRDSGTQFNLYTYCTNYDGSLETIQDFAGNVYGLDHGSREAWGF